MFDLYAFVFNNFSCIFISSKNILIVEYNCP